MITSKLPKTHVLDACSHKLASTSRHEIDVFNLEGKRMQKQVNTQQFLSFPVKQHYALVKVFSEALRKVNNKKLTTMRICWLSAATLIVKITGQLGSSSLPNY